jgi:uncharacterized protein YlaI
MKKNAENLLDISKEIRMKGKKSKQLPILSYLITRICDKTIMCQITFTMNRVTSGGFQFGPLNFRDVNQMLSGSTYLVRR